MTLRQDMRPLSSSGAGTRSRHVSFKPRSGGLVELWHRPAVDPGSQVGAAQARRDRVQGLSKLEEAMPSRFSRAIVIALAAAVVGTSADLRMAAAGPIAPSKAKGQDLGAASDTTDFSS